MRIYVGTLYTIENEFEACKASIRRQTHPNFKHFVFSGLGNVEAHAALYEDFLRKQDEFDLLVKVDADMVLADDHLFEAIEAIFLNKDLSILTISVHDWFSDRLISGLNIYRKDAIVWTGQEGGVFVDNVKIRKGRADYDRKRLAPAAYHCPDPSPFQAFHFGLHKAMKVVQPHDAARVHWRMREHWENIAKTEAHFEKTGDRRLALAVLASELVYSGRFKPEHLTYSHPFLKKVFAEYENMQTEAVRGQIGKLRQKNGGWLPEHIRQALIWYKFRSRRVSFNAVKALMVDCFRPGVRSNRQGK